MRIAIAYPPFKKGKQFAQLSQNRQFRYMYSQETKIFPLVMATGATLLKNNGYGVLWLDGINERLSMDVFLRQLYAFKPDLIVFETKTPLIKKHWKLISKIKKDIGSNIALVGDHITFFPEESLKNSKADFCLTGGDYDVSMLGLADYLGGRKKVPKGCYYKDKGRIKNTGRFELVKNLDKLPFIDRELTKWKLYYEAYLYKPCTYILTGRGCGGNSKQAGKCTFCIWQHSFWRCTARLRSPKNVVQEIKYLVENYNIREVFDDNEAGPVWNKKWLSEFYKEMKKENLIGKVILSSNARADSLDKEACELLRKLRWRLLKVGLESGNQNTLDRLHKLESLEEIKKGIKNAKDHGLIIMLTTMVGYPWETEDDTARTYETAKELMLHKTHFGDVLQSSVITPYPGTPLYYEARKNNWFNYDPRDYEKYDMSYRILKTNVDTDKWCAKMWKVHYEPKFILKSLFSLRSFEDVKMAFRGIRSLIGHVKDYD